MPEIGEMLRETRMRQRIDIQELEAQTKIRAKYLRALENEEWDLLPGPTFVKTFLRTYAEALGLDARLLVEEYKQRFERPSPQELLPFAPVGARRDRRRGPVLSPFVVVTLCVVALLGILYALGQFWPAEEEDPREPNVVATPGATREPAASPSASRRRRSTASRVVRLVIRPQGTVFTCLIDASGRRLINGRDLGPAGPTRTFRSRRFRVTFGNGQVSFRAGRRRVNVPDRSTPVGYEITSRRVRELSADRRPNCS